MNSNFDFHIIRKIFVLTIFLFIFITSKSAFAQSNIDCSVYNATNYTQTGIASYNIVFEPDRVLVNPGENLYFNVYFPGKGIVEDSLLNFYFDTNVEFHFYICNLRYVSTFYQWGWIKPPLAYFYCSYDGTATVAETECHIPNGNQPFFPVLINASLPSNIPEGDHIVKAVFSYKDLNGNWHSSEDVRTFHVRTWSEAFYYSSALLIAISALAVSFVSLI